MGRHAPHRAPTRSAAQAILVAAVCCVTAHAQSRVLRAAAYVDPAGAIQAPAIVVISDGKIERLGGDLPTGAPVDDYPGMTLCPGLVDCRAQMTAVGNLRESASPLQPGAAAADAFDRFSPQLSAALRAGVTTFALTPTDANLIGGQIAVCQTSGPNGRPAVLEQVNAPMAMSLSAEAYRPDAEPTSRSGAIGMLRDALERAAKTQPDGSPGSRLLERVVAGDSSRTAGKRLRLPVFFAAPTGADVLAAVELAGADRMKLVLVHTNDARDIADSLESAHGLIVGPLHLGDPPRRATAAAVLATSKLPLAIAGGLPAENAASLRIGAAVAAGGGLAPEAARRAITSTPAELLGVGDRVGALKPGLRADIVVFSGDPLDLRSRVVAVYSGGSRVVLAGAGREAE